MTIVYDPEELRSKIEPLTLSFYNCIKTIGGAFLSELYPYSQ